MGLKKIAALREEMSKKVETARAFAEKANVYVEAHRKMEDAIEALDKTRKSNLSKIEAIETYGIKEFDDYKKSLISVFSGFGRGIPLPTKPLEAVIERERKAIDEAVQKHLEKLAAAFPKEVKKGMLFKAEFGERKIYEAVTESYAAKNANLKGDAATWFDFVGEDGKKLSMSLADLKKSFKFVKD